MLLSFGLILIFIHICVIETKFQIRANVEIIPVNSNVSHIIKNALKDYSESLDKVESEKTVI